jgi:hypothetical protein
MLEEAGQPYRTEVIEFGPTMPAANSTKAEYPGSWLEHERSKFGWFRLCWTTRQNADRRRSDLLHVGMWGGRYGL